MHNGEQSTHPPSPASLSDNPLIPSVPGRLILPFWHKVEKLSTYEHHRFALSVTNSFFRESRELHFWPKDTSVANDFMHFTVFVSFENPGLHPSSGIPLFRESLLITFWTLLLQPRLKPGGEKEGLFGVKRRVITPRGV